MSRTTLPLPQLREKIRSGEAAVSVGDGRRFTVERSIYPGTQIVTLNGQTLAYGDDYSLEDDAIILAFDAGPDPCVLVTYVPTAPGEVPLFGAVDPAALDGTGARGASMFVSRGDHRHGIADGAVALRHLASGTAGRVVGYDAEGRPAAIDPRPQTLSGEIDAGTAVIVGATVDRLSERLVDLSRMAVDADFSADAICRPCLVTGFGDLVLDGPDVGVDGAVMYGPYRGHRISVTSDGPMPGVRIYGVGVDGNDINEIIPALQGAGTGYTTAFFVRVTRVFVGNGNGPFSVTCSIGRDLVAFTIDPALGLAWYLPFPDYGNDRPYSGITFYLRKWQGGGTASLLLMVKHPVPTSVEWRVIAPATLAWHQGVVPDRPAAGARETFLFHYTSLDDVIRGVRTFKS